MTTRRKLSVLLSAAMALAVFSWGAEPVRGAQKEPMPRMTHAQRQAAAAARKNKIKAAVKAQQAEIKAAEQQNGPAHQSQSPRWGTPSHNTGK